MDTKTRFPIDPDRGAAGISLARALRSGDVQARTLVSRMVLPLDSENLVPRPWGGRKILAYKGVDAGRYHDSTFGENFEVAADVGDGEAREHPSIVVFPDGSRIPLPELLVRAGDEILGREFTAVHGYRWPLLPKILDVNELLSVQAHPSGCTELYVILDAEPGATLFVGFRADTDAGELRELVRRGRELQEDLAARLRDDLDSSALQEMMAPRFADREADLATVVAALHPLLRTADPTSREAAADPGAPAIADQIASLHRIYWAVLDKMNAIPVEAGQVMLNAVPSTAGRGGYTTAVHALGNPQRREVLILEVRRPCSTLRIWDNARFPLRRLDVDGALAVVPLSATAPESLMVQPQPLADRPGTWRLAATPHFVVDRLRPGPHGTVSLPSDGQPRSLHVVRGVVAVIAADGSERARLAAGTTALLPADIGELRLADAAGSVGAQEPAEAFLVAAPQPEGVNVEFPRPAFLDREPSALRFGTSGLRGLVRDMTDLEVYVNTRGFLRYLARVGDALPDSHVVLGEDLRTVDPHSGIASSPRIARAVARAVRDEGFTPRSAGRIPTPALAHFAAYGAPRAPVPAIMVTGSHIPEDRNGIKFYRASGEVLKADEPGILACVAEVRRSEYARSRDDSPFGRDGMFREAPEISSGDAEAARLYLRRYLELFEAEQPLRKRRVVFVEHSAVGRDLFRELLAGLGATVVPVERSDRFLPVDTENVDIEAESHYRELVTTHRADALVTTDGDSDRPLVVDERGHFHRGDLVGLLTAAFLAADCWVVPVSVSDALDRHLQKLRTAGAKAPRLVKTRIGSPYVIAAMQAAVAEGFTRVVGWEANGGFLTGTDIELAEGRLTALPTRDAALPVVAVLVQAARRDVALSELFATLPQRATRAGLIDRFPTESSVALLARVRPSDPDVRSVTYGQEAWTVRRMDGGEKRCAVGDRVDEPGTIPANELARGTTVDAETRDVVSELRRIKARLESYFSMAEGFGPVKQVDYLDGVRIVFANGDIAHLRPSGNAPQLRAYAVADSQERADRIVELAIAEPQGILRRMEREPGS